MKGLTDAKRSLAFEILKEDVARAKRHDKNFCVIAQALQAAPWIKKVEVGARYSRVWQGTTVWRYMTPAILRVALNEFDRSGHWGLPAGVYVLKAPTPGRTLQWESEYEKTRTAAQRARKKKRNPDRKGVHTPRALNPRVIEFARLRKDR